MQKSTEMYMARFKIEQYEKWDDIRTDIPSINFDKEWDVKIVPPFGGAIVRFLIFKKDKQVCSVYLDWYDRLGCVGEPYYELYPFEEDVKRYLINNVIELQDDIRKLYKDSE